MRTATTDSSFSGRSVSKSRLRRRSMNGPTIEASRRARSWSPPTMSSSNFSLKRMYDPRNPGITKSKMLQISLRRFSIGVPVRANRWRASRRLMARAVSVPWFLMYCASSRVQQYRRLADHSAASMRARSYEVTYTSMPLLARAVMRSRLEPTTGSTHKSGANRSNSAAQLYTSDAGHTMRLGPMLRALSRRLSRNAISCSVLPRPISSARMPPNSMSASVESQRNPSSWYGRSTPARESGTRYRVGSMDSNRST